jgi:DNA-binding protein YbaB
MSKAQQELGQAQVDQRELATAIAVLLNGKSELAKWIWDEYALLCMADAREEAYARELAMENHPTAYTKDEAKQMVKDYDICLTDDGNDYCPCPNCSSQD